MKAVLFILILWTFVSGAVYLQRIRQTELDKDQKVYEDVLEAIVVKQRDELFSRGYATDDSVCVGPAWAARGWCEETYLKKETK